MITSYNKPAMGDTLVVVLAPDVDSQQTAHKAGITGIYDAQGAAVGFNFFDVSRFITIQGNGQVELTTAQVEALNQALREAGLAGELPLADTPKFVIGKIVDFQPHPKSDHLHITQVDFGTHQEQIVCGAPNAALGETVVAALPGAMMPDGKIIWPGKLLEVQSNGMLCSARELGIPGAPEQRGILLMPAQLEAGTPFDFAKAESVVAALA